MTDSSFPLDHEFPKDYGLDEEDDEVDIDGERLFNELPAQVNAKKQKRKQTKAYTHNEDKLLCECWRYIGQDPKIGFEQKASVFWLRVHHEFHEHKKFRPYQMKSNRGWVLLGKCWSVIQQKCNKFCSSLQSIETRPVSGIGMEDMVWPTCLLI
uniref:Uncharacterized protein n=1 Tax=Hordeum vulgare subsp. vulgare TaxID=112509 RepID=A0A8I6XHC0_HORVV